MDDDPEAGRPSIPPTPEPMILPMGFEPNLEDQDRFAETRRREHAAVARRGVQVEAPLAALFLASILGLWLVRHPGALHLGDAGACLLLAALAMRVRFQTPFGFTVATQLAFVPLAFTVPAAWLPVAVLLALALARLPEMLTGRVSWTKLIYGPGNSCFALGPAWVFALAGSPRHAGGAVLLAALAAQLAIDFAASAVYNAAVRGATLRSQLGETWWVWAIDGALSMIGLVIAEQTTRAPLALGAILPLLGLLAMFAREREGRLEKLVELNETYKGTALLLGDVVEADDAYTGRHSQRVVELALAVGATLGLELERRRDLEFAALLHDVGKIAIPKEIINKPGGLDAGEWEIVKTHTVEGQRMLARVGGFMSVVGAIVRSHHERWDGRGYPDGLLADAVPLEARIITCCDSWSAMRTDRPYRRAMSHEAALAELSRNIGTQFDPTVAGALLAVVGDRAEDASAAVSAGLDSLLRSETSRPRGGRRVPSGFGARQDSSGL